MQRRFRMSVSLPAELVAYARERAAATGVTVSAVVEEAISRHQHLRVYDEIVLALREEQRERFNGGREFDVARANNDPGRLAVRTRRQ